MCCSKGLLKRLVPFFGTFALGLLVASFFVSVAAPNFRFGRGFRHRDYDRRMQDENQRLREEVIRLKADPQAKYKISGTFEMNDDGSVKRIERMEATIDDGNVNELVPPPPPIR